VTDRIDHLQGHQLVGQQLQCPVSVTGWRLAQAHRNQLRFPFAIELGRRRRCLALFAFQSQFKPFRNQPLAHILDRLLAAVVSLGDFGIRPRRPIGIGLEQDLSAASLLRRPLPFLDDLLTHDTLFFRQPHDVLLVHGIPP
jgi:hypothetical protein